MEKTTPESRSSTVVLATVVAVVICAGMAWAAHQQAPERGYGWKDGADVYTKICAYCHEEHVGPALLGRDLDPLYIHLIVRNGDRAMPAFRASEIDDESLEKLAQYISTSVAK